MQGICSELYAYIIAGYVILNRSIGSLVEASKCPGFLTGLMLVTFRISHTYGMC